MRYAFILQVTILHFSILSASAQDSSKDKATMDAAATTTDRFVPPETKAWPEGASFDLKGVKVSLSAPVLVRRDREPYYFPKISRLPNNELVLCSSIDRPVNLSVTDESFKPERSEILWSGDGGLNWKDPQIIPDASSLRILLSGGDLIFAPYRTFELPKNAGLCGPFYSIPKGKHEVRV